MVVSGDTHIALCRAITAGRPRQVRLLLESGVGVNNTDSCGETPLIRSVFIQNARSRMKIIRLLLRRKAVIGHQDYIGRSALSWACQRGVDDVVEMLLEKGEGDIDLNETDMNDCTPLFHAATAGNAASVKLLVDALRRYGLSVDVPNEDGITPLMQAIRVGNDVCAGVLLHQGKASATIRDNTRRSAVDWAGEMAERSNFRTNFLPLIVSLSGAELPGAGKSEHRRYFVGTSWHCDDSDSDSEMKSTTTRCPYDLAGSELSDAKSEMSCGESSYCSSESSGSGLSSCDSSPEIARRSAMTVQTFSAFSRPNSREDNDSVFDSSSNYPSSARLTSNNLKLPKLYNLYSHQLCDTFRPGAKPVSPRPQTANQDGDHTDCELECCVPLGSVLVSEEKLQKVVLANRKAREAQTGSDGTPRSNSAISRRTTSTRFPSLRKQATQRRFLEAHMLKSGGGGGGSDAVGKRSSPSLSLIDEKPHVHVSADDTSGTDQSKSNFPALSLGKTSLIATDNSEKPSATAQKELDKILSTGSRNFSL